LAIDRFVERLIRRRETQVVGRSTESLEGRRYRFVELARACIAVRSC
jgi:hypothetical protein